MSEEGRRLLFMACDPVALTAWALIIFNIGLMRRRRMAAFRCTFALTSALFLLAASPFAANELLGWLEKQARALATCAAPPPGSVLVTLAGGIRKDTSDAGDIAEMELPTFRRTVAAAHLALKIPGSILLLSGGSGDAVREADLMATLARALGVDAGQIVEERASRTTLENALEARPLLARLDGRAVYLVTSAIHLPRAAWAFRSVGVAICPLPVDFQQMEPEGADAWIPSVAALQRTSASVRELVARLFYRWEIRRGAAAATSRP